MARPVPAARTRAARTRTARAAPPESAPPESARPGLWRPDWAADWIDWPDFGTPRDDQLAADLIAGAYLRARAGNRIEVACDGGTGRTGTVIACMAILTGHPTADALAWTRQHYRPRAVETPGQRRWILWFGTHAAH